MESYITKELEELKNKRNKYAHKKRKYIVGISAGCLTAITSGAVLPSGIESLLMWCAGMGFMCYNGIKAYQYGAKLGDCQSKISNLEKELENGN